MWAQETPTPGDGLREPARACAAEHAVDLMVEDWPDMAMREHHQRVVVLVDMVNHESRLPPNRGSQGVKVQS
jgi:hypothetical protein